jgi:SpoVK/Ycf46/Vps4 family AAA+-type ATPase
MFGTLLTYLSDHESDVFIVASANDISRLPPEFSRAERFDGVFFLDLPGPRERQMIWDMYIRKFGLDPAQRKPQDRDWVGAEIRSCCRLAALLDVTLIEAATNIVPVAVTAGEAVKRLRQWASGGASRPIDQASTRVRATGCPGRAGVFTAGIRRPTDPAL